MVLNITNHTFITIPLTAVFRSSAFSGVFRAYGSTNMSTSNLANKLIDQTVQELGWLGQ